MKVAVTGASGFVGRHLVRGLRAHGHAVRSLVRDLSTAPESDEARAVDLSSAGPLDEPPAIIPANFIVRVMRSHQTFSERGRALMQQSE